MTAWTASPARLALFGLVSLAFAAALYALVGGYSLPVVEPVLATIGMAYTDKARMVVETGLLLAYSLGLVAFPERLPRRLFKLAALLGTYLVLIGPLSATLDAAMERAGLPAAGAVAAVLIAASRLVAIVIALMAGYAIYRVCWPRLRDLPARR
ncbi:MAG: hypothetical protein R3D45_16090 [Rhizobiaceae bacterium]